MDIQMNQYCTRFVHIGLAGLLLSLCHFKALAFELNDYAPSLPSSVHHIPNATPKPEPYSQYGNPDTYVIEGRVYHVKKHSKDHTERGTASWYGMKFHGKRTSSGELYNIYGMTAAHKTLPLPTYATVTNLKNGKSVLVKINDRGPFVDDRVIDLSFAAAQKLNIVGNGTAPVEIRAISFEEEVPFDTTTPHFLQLGAFSSYNNAWQLRQKVKHIGQELIHIHVSQQHSGPLYHVKVGPVQNQAQNIYILSQLSQLGLANFSHILNKA